jgi:hypothetical protein
MAELMGNTSAVPLLQVNPHTDLICVPHLICLPLNDWTLLMVVWTGDISVLQLWDHQGLLIGQQ